MLGGEKGRGLGSDGVCFEPRVTQIHSHILLLPCYKLFIPSLLLRSSLDTTIFPSFFFFLLHCTIVGCIHCNIHPSTFY